MNHPTHDKSPMALALDAIEGALRAWTPESAATPGAGVGSAIAGLREAQLHFDPRKLRLASSLCTSSMRLLEDLDKRGAVRPEVAVEVVRDLFEQLRVALDNATSAAPSAMRILPGAVPSQAGGASSASRGPSLSLKLVDDLRLGELMVKMSMISQADCDRVLRAQAESRAQRKKFGELCIELGACSREVVEAALRMQLRSRGQTPAPAPSGDPWGDRPL